MRKLLGLALLIGTIAALSAFLASGSSTQMASAAQGDLVGQVTFSTRCSSGIGVGVAFDGNNLWYSCYQQSPDLYKANPTTGSVIASYNIAGGLGALAWDEGRQMWDNLHLKGALRSLPDV